MSSSYCQSPSQIIKQIKQSNHHVQTIIDSAKKIIYNHQSLSLNEKQKLQLEISMQKDKLKNSFYQINTNYQNFSLSLTNLKTQPNSSRIQSKNSKQLYQNKELLPFKGQIKRNIIKEPIQKKESINQLNSISQANKRFFPSSEIFFKENQNGKQFTQMIISRYNQEHLQNKNLKDQYEQLLSLKEKKQCQIDISEPLVNSKIVIKTMIQSSDQIQEITYKNYSGCDSRKKDSKDTLKYINNSLKIPIYQQQINLKTPKRQCQIINKQIDISYRPFQHFEPQSTNQLHSLPLSKVESSKQFPITASFIEKQQQFSNSNSNKSQVSTSFKDIVHKNKEKLQISQLKQSQIKQKSPRKFQIHLQELYKKKEENKRRVYGPNYATKNKDNDFSTIKKYSIASNQKEQELSSRKKKGQNSNMNKSLSSSFWSLSGSRCHSQSKSKNNHLHSRTIKQNHMEFTSECSRCKGKTSGRKQKTSEAMSSYHLAKKYLTAQGQKQCYNFLRLQGIEQKDWPIFITEYVYRQLSKVYKQLSPKKGYDYKDKN